MMNESIFLKEYANGRLIGPRITATSILEKVELALHTRQDVVLNFAGVEATQSFIDGLVGVLILKHGPSVLEKLIFKSCSDDVKAIVQFVAADRCDQYLKQNSH